MNDINTLRLTGLFKKELTPVNIIGCGAIGSKVALEVAKLGCDNITLWDFDKVESHNLSNQVFTKKCIGMQKVDALKTIIQQTCSPDIEAINEEYTSEPLVGIVFLCVDSMKTRREIVSRIIMQPHVPYIIETRMGIDEVRCYVITRDKYDLWKEFSNYEDSNSEVSACGTSLTVGATASIVASIATWQYMKLHMNKRPEFEVTLSTDGFGLLTGE